MIKRIYRSKTDIENLSNLRTAISEEIDKFDYKNVVVEKPWGYEYLMFENQYVGIWVLYLKRDHATSMHCHPNKKSSLIVISGDVICSNLEGWIPRTKGEGLIIDEAVFHSTKAMSKKGAYVIEIESPPNKKDLVRLKDGYGRENQKYEGVDKMSRDILRYRYVDFHDSSHSQKITKTLKGCHLSVCKVKNSPSIHNQLKKDKAHLICMLKGKLHDQEGNVVLATGDVAPLKKIALKKQIIAFGDIIYLSIYYP